MITGTELKQIRENMELSQHQMARACGLQTRQYGDIELGKAALNLQLEITVHSVYAKYCEEMSDRYKGLAWSSRKKVTDLIELP